MKELPRLNQFHPSKLDIGSIRKLHPEPKRKKSLAKPKIEFQPMIELLPFRPLLTFGAACLIVVIVLQVFPLGVNQILESERTILGLSTSAYDDLNSAAQNLQNQNFTDASRLFDSARAQLEKSLDELNRYAAVTVLSSQARSAKSAISAAADLSLAGRKVAESLDLLNQLKVSSEGIQTSDFSQKMQNNRVLLGDALRLLASAKQKLNQAENLPPEFSQQIELVKAATSSFTYIVQKFADLQELYLLLTGNKPKTFLLVFPNTDEARATGGFIGTYGVVRVDQGKITHLKIDSVYNFDGSLTLLIASPGPMQPEIETWGLRDANWFADFSTSAKKLAYIFEKGSQTVDGVISISPTVFEDILRLTGPIQMSQYEVTLTPENFHDVVQRKTSIEYDKTINRPKKFLDDFAPILLNRLSNLDQKQWLELLQVLQKDFDARQILVYSSDPEAAGKLREMNFDGHLLTTDKDFLSIVNTNLSGTKNDHDIRQEAHIESKVKDDGTIINKLALTRANPSKESNKDYVRVLVPAGSKLLSMEGNDKLITYKTSNAGLKVDRDLVQLEETEMESGKQVFAFWMNVEANRSETVNLIYELPFELNTNFIDKTDSYSLLFQKQPAKNPIRFSAKFDVGQFEPVWLSSGPVFSNSVIEYNSEDLTDDFWSVVLRK